MSEIVVKRKPFFYDHQIKRYLVQLMSCFAGYQVMTGKQRDGKRRFINVPIMFGDMSRLAAWALGGKNENAARTLPAMALDISRLKQDEKLRRAPGHTELYYYHEKTAPGSEAAFRTMIAERRMPVPYDLGVRLSIWASNNEQLHQLIEQIATVFNPELDILLSNSPVDWTFKSVLKFDGTINIGRASADVGAGTGEDQNYVASMDFTTTVHMSPPTKVYDAQHIESVHAVIKTLNSEIDWETMDIIETVVVVADE
jgi:hypothetical protein